MKILRTIALIDVKCQDKITIDQTTFRIYSEQRKDFPLFPHLFPMK